MVTCSDQPTVGESSKLPSSEGAAFYISRETSIAGNYC